ncbi:MAG: DUF11 domain-containing protein, partial [Parcubacteria group bacterium]|nr:DUF11 domain-containing protein [Parcubacteria group bacterium]
MKLKIFLFALLFFILTPFITKASVWEQSSQADFERGSTSGDIIIADEEVKILPGRVYENAEDENTNGWSIFTADTSGEFRNVFDETSRSRVIEFDDGVPDGYAVGYKYGSAFTNPLNIKWDIKSNQRFLVYVVITTSEGTRVLSYSPSNRTEIRGLQIRHTLPIPYDGNWHTIERDLSEDLQRFEPDNRILEVRYFSLRGNVRLDNIVFSPDISSYISPTLNMGENEVASLGRIIWEEEVPERTSLTLQSRTSADGSSWSEWSEEYDNAAGEAVTSTPQRYFQYKANIDNGSNVEAIPRLRRTLLEYNRAPNATENLLPANDRRLSNTDNLTWDTSSDPDSEDTLTYTLEIDSHAEFSSLDSVTSRVVNTEININQLENFANLQDDTRYYWRIKTVDSQNNQSAYSAGEKFFILDKENQAPLAPNAGFNPSQGGIVKAQKPTIYWGAASDPDDADTKETLSYIVQVDENSSFDSAQIYNTEVNRTNFTIPEKLEDNTQYSYRIKTKDNEDAESAWSNIQSFVVATGKNPIIAVSKTVGINTDNDDQSSLLLGFVNNNINFTNFEYLYWLAIILVIAVAFFFLNKNILFNYILAPAHSKKGSNKKQKLNYLFARSIRSLDGVNNTKKVATEVKGSRTKTVIAIIILIGIIALTLAGIYYYDDNPSPHKDDGKNIQIGDELIYRIDFANEGESSASNFNILDSIPEGTSYIENTAIVNGDSQTDTSDDDLVTLNSSKLEFEFGEVAAKSSGYVSFQVKVENIPENHKIENTADILFSESDGVQNTNQTTNYIENGTSTISSIKGVIWNDSNSNKSKDEGEYGIEGVVVRLYEDKNNDSTLGEADNSYLTEGATDSGGNYQFNNITSGNYFVKIDEENLSDNSSITTENNPQLITVDEIKEYSDISFGISSGDDEIIVEDAENPGGSIGNLIWMDSDSNGSKDFGEIGLENVNIKLYEDNNDNGTLEFDQDTYVSLHKTDSNGNYQVTGLSPKTYLILV